MKVYIVRHAQSRQNVHDPEDVAYVRPEVKEYESRDYSLTPHGEDQADRVGRRLSQVKFDAVFCGPLHRHIATANAILRYQEECKTIEILSDLTEIDVPNYEGMPPELWAKLFPDINVIPCPDPPPTGGKMSYSEEELGDWINERKRAQRVERFLTERFGEDDSKNILIISSVNFYGRVLAPALLRLSDEAIDKCIGFGCDNGSIGCIKLYKSGTSSRCFCVNDTLHLHVPEKDKDIISKLPLFN